jgi:hypothetical protein
MRAVEKKIELTTSIYSPEKLSWYSTLNSNCWVTYFLSLGEIKDKVKPMSGFFIAKLIVTCLISYH